MTNPTYSSLDKKVCRDCLNEKVLADFPRNKTRLDGYGIYCKSCFSVGYKAHRERRAAAAGRVIRERREVPEGHKYCPGCKSTKLQAEFGNNRSARDGLTSYCKPCHNAKGKETYTRLYGSTREFHLRRRYGIGQADFDRMMAEQGGACAVCGKPDPGHIDHDHKGGHVRGLLCFNCNQALGNVRDSLRVVEGLRRYLIRDIGATTESLVERRLAQLLTRPAV